MFIYLQLDRVINDIKELTFVRSSRHMWFEIILVVSYRKNVTVCVSNSSNDHYIRVLLYINIAMVVIKSMN